MSRQDIPDWLLERFRLGEVTAEQRARVEQALAVDPSLSARLAALDADSAATLAQHPPARVAAQLRQRAESQVATPSTRRWLLPALAMATAAALALVLVPRSDDDDVRSKGDGARLALFRLTAQGPQPLDDRATVRAGDVVQARFGVDEAGYVALLSFDALGQVTVHVPQQGGSTASDAGSFTTQRSFELDATPGFERFVLFTSPRPLSLELLSAAAKQAAGSAEPRDVALGVGAGVHQRSVVLVKESP